MTREPQITVLTATYNRASLLPRLHRSLCEQTFRDFEWLVIDDGSTDDTRAVVDVLRVSSPGFATRYVYKPNGGLHTAVNAGVAEARGVFCAILDSDDWYAPTCLERLKSAWDEIADPDSFADVQGLCATEDGAIIGSPFPAPTFDSDYYELNWVLGISGDRLGMHRTDVLRSFPFPEDFRSSYVPPALVWNRIARRYRTRCVNEVVGYKEYQAAGLSRTVKRPSLELSDARLALYDELLRMQRALPMRNRLRAYANVSRYGLHAARPVSRVAIDAPSKRLWALMLPVGAALAARDRFRAKRGSAAQKLSPAALIEDRPRRSLRAPVSILGIRIDRLTRFEAMQRIERLVEERHGALVVFVNAHTANVAAREERFRDVLSRADLVLNDGVGVAIAARLYRRPFPENLNGSDLVPQVMRAAAEHGWRVYLLGGRPGVAEAAAAALRVELPALRVCGHHHGYFRPDQSTEIARSIQRERTDLVLVGMGNPLQECWLAEWLPTTGAAVGFGVGAFLDFAAGRVRRAPGWMNRAGIEWLFRLVQEPARLTGRYLFGNPAFLIRTLADVVGRARGGVPD